MQYDPVLLVDERRKVSNRYAEGIHVRLNASDSPRNNVAIFFGNVPLA